MIKEPVVCLVTAYKGMLKKELYDMFFPEQEKEYYKKGNKEFLSFSNSVLKGAGNAIRFYLIDGKVERWYFFDLKFD